MVPRLENKVSRSAKWQHDDYDDYDDKDDGDGDYEDGDDDRDGAIDDDVYFELNRLV